MKKIFVMLLAVVMTVMSVGATNAFAAEITPENDIIVAENNETVTPRYVENKRFTEVVYPTITSPVPGRKFFGDGYNQLRIKVNFTPSGGSHILAVRLHNVTIGGTLVQEWQSSNGVINVIANVDPHMEYQLAYLVAYGSGTVNVTTEVYGINPYI